MTKTRVQLDMTQKMCELVDKLEKETGAFTRAEVIRRAISIYALLVEEHDKGSTITLSMPDGAVRELIVF